MRLLINKTMCHQLFNYMYNYNYNSNRTWNGKKALVLLSFDVDMTKDVLSLKTLMDVLSSYDYKTSFACIGKWVEKYPKEHEKILENGHEIINHTYSHPNNDELNPNEKFNELSTDEKKYEIKKCHNICKEILDYNPKGFRVPHFGDLFTEDIYLILSELKYSYSSSIVASKSPTFTLPYVNNGIVEFPISPCPKHPFGVLDTWHSLERGVNKHQNDFVDLFEKMILKAKEKHSIVNIYWDPQDIINLNSLNDLLDLIVDKDILVTTYRRAFEEMKKNKYFE